MREGVAPLHGRHFKNGAITLAFHNIYKPAEVGRKHRCPCCKFRTLDERGGFNICPVCFWEDDGQEEHDADTVRGGPNGALSLRAAQANYSAIGAYDESAVGFVRPPSNEEKLK